MNTAILLYDGFTALDAIGPYEVLSRLPGGSVTFVAAEAGPVRTDNGMLTMHAERSLADVRSPEIVLVPGGPGEVAERAGGPALEWLRAAHETSVWTTSVCTGSLILAAAGLLGGKRATGHWLAMEKLGELGAVPVSERYVIEGKIATAAGVSAGIDMALTLAARGAKVFLACRSEEKAAPVIEAIKAKGGDAHFHAPNVEDIGIGAQLGGVLAEGDQQVGRMAGIDSGLGQAGAQGSRARGAAGAGAE